MVCKSMKQKVHKLPWCWRYASCDVGGEWLLFGIISVEVVVGDVDKSLSSVRDVDEGGDGKDEHDNDALASWSDLKQNSSSERSPARR